MSDLEIGLLAWLAVAVLAGLVIGRFLRMPEFDESIDSARKQSAWSIPLAHGGGEERRGRAHGSTMPNPANSACPPECGATRDNP